MKLKMLLLFCTFALAAGELTQIRLSPNATMPENYAATELRDVLRKMTGKDFEIVREDALPTPGLGAFVLGTPMTCLAVKRYRKELSLPGKGANDTVTYKIIDGNLYLAGKTPREVLYSVYAYLNNEHNVCWFFPGDEGEYIPKKVKIEAKADLSYQFTSAFAYRSLGCFSGYPVRKVEVDKWQVRNFLNVGLQTELVQELTGVERKAGGHTIAIYDRNMFRKHPDWYALLPGQTERTPKGNMGCWSNPGFHAYMVDKHIQMADKSKLSLLSLYPADSGYVCNCPECEKIDKDPGTRFYKYFDKLADDIKAKRPDLKFATIAYMYYANPPKDYKIRNAQFVEYCQYGLCLLHGMDDENCTINQGARTIYNEWRKQGKIGYFGYDFSSYVFRRSKKKPDLSVPIWRLVPRNAKVYKQLGVIYIKTGGGLVERKPGKSMLDNPYLRRGFSLSLTPQAYWNPDFDADRYMKLWATFSYGPAAEVMLGFHNAFADSWCSQTDTHSHPFPFAQPPTSLARKVLDLDLIVKANKAFDQAEQLVANLPACYRERIALDRVVFKEWTDAYETAQKEALRPVHVYKGNSFDDAVELPLHYKYGKFLPAKVKIYWNDRAIYFQASSAHPNLNSLNDRETSPWKQKTQFELFIGGPGTADHFVISPSNAVYTERSFNPNHRPKWSHSTMRSGNTWTATFSIPFGSVKVANAKAGSIVKLVLVRNIGQPYGQAQFPRLFEGATCRDLSGMGSLVLTEKVPANQR